MKVFALHNTDSHIRKCSSAGGVFTYLAEAVIKRGGVVYGAGFDKEWNVCHKRVTHINELVELRGSKYVFSRVGSSIKDAVEDINNGTPVLFSGTPCQAAAMRKLAPRDSDLLIVEVVCHGAPRPEYWERYLYELCAKLNHTRNDIHSVSFRDKRSGWKTYSFSIKFKDGSEFTEKSGDNLYMRAFLRDLTLREPCFHCKFKQCDGSHADITLGDFWGIEHIIPQFDNNLGTTIAIASTPNGEKAMYNLPKLCEPAYDAVVKFNPAICYPASRPHSYKTFTEEAKRAKSLILIFKKYAGHTLKERLKKIIKKVLNR